jgi:acetaldehyde dehydrogenase (acetylating)
MSVMLHDNDLISIQEVREKVEKAWAAQQKYATFTQEQVDAVVESMGAAGRAHAVELAEMAVEETAYGNVQDKIAKNLLNAEHLPNYIRNMKTVGVLRELPAEKVIEIGMPVGVVAAVVPTTNPTSTAIYKTIISLKGGNGVVISPHPRAKKCTAYTADLMHKAAVEAGAPEGIIQCLTTPTTEGTQALMSHKKIGVILATGGSGMVRAAYSSGKPAFGVGPGNVPVLLDSNYDLADAISKLVAGKAFDYGTVCSSEQSLVTYLELKEKVIAELKKNKAHFADDQQKQALGKLLVSAGGTINPACVGQSPQKIAKMAGFQVPDDTSIIVAEIDGVGKFHPLSAEKLSPVLSVYFVKDFAAAMDICDQILHFGGMGHTCVIFSNDQARVREFGLRMPAMRVLVNTDSPGGSTGLTTNLLPSMTLGCGAMGGNVTSDNVGPQHLINIKRIAWWVRDARQVVHLPDYRPAAKVVAAAAAPVAGSPGIDRQTVAAAVEKYLAQRGISLSGSPAAAPAPVPEAPKAATVANVAAAVVDHFLASHNPVGRAAEGSACATCSYAGKPAGSPAPAPAPAQPEPNPPPPAPKITIVDFVAETDVREAIKANKKIYIGPKTIVTPAARELGDQHDTLVMAQRA